MGDMRHAEAYLHTYVTEAWRLVLHHSTEHETGNMRAQLPVHNHMHSMSTLAESGY